MRLHPNETKTKSRGAINEPRSKASALPRSFETMASPVARGKSPSTSPRAKEQSASASGSPRHSPSQSAGAATPLAGLVAGDADNPVPVQVDVSVCHEDPRCRERASVDVYLHVQTGV